MKKSGAIGGREKKAHYIGPQTISSKMRYNFFDLLRTIHVYITLLKESKLIHKPLKPHPSHHDVQQHITTPLVLAS